MNDAPGPLLQILLETFRSELRSDQPDLTMRQLAVALTVNQTDEPQTVRGLARHLNISKPAVTRALDRLEELGLVRRQGDSRDKRSIIAVGTLNGGQMMQRLGACMLKTSEGKR